MLLSNDHGDGPEGRVPFFARPGGEWMQGKVTLREEEFCRQYVVLRNGTRAALAAGYAEGSAAVQASRLLKKDKVLRRIAELEAEWRADSNISREQIIAELKAIAFSNIQDDLMPTDMDPQHYLPFGEEVIRALPARPRYVTAAIESVRVTKAGEVEVRRHNKVAALAKLAEILGLTAPVDVNVNVNVAEGLADARERIAAYGAAEGTE